MPFKISSFETPDNFFEKLDKVNRLARKLELDPAVLGRHGKELFSGDAASLYVLGEDEKKKALVKLGWGEFCRDTFSAPVEQAIYQGFDKAGRERAVNKLNNLRNLPGPIYCVRQQDSYLADSQTRELMTSNPEKYLAEKAYFVFCDGEVVANPNLTRSSEKGGEKTIPVKSAALDELIAYLEKI